MQTLPFNQTRAELMVRIAASIVMNGLARQGARISTLAELAQPPQYGFTSPAKPARDGNARMVRITDLKDGSIHWESVPFCQCDRPEQYQLRTNDILFARTGEGATGKTHLVGEVPTDVPSVFASYLIRVRPLEGVRPGYLYCFLELLATSYRAPARLSPA
jgi:type I restriction enzyme S subunit